MHLDTSAIKEYVGNITSLYGLIGPTWEGNMPRLSTSLLIIALTIVSHSWSRAAEPRSAGPASQQPATVDYTSYIDANRILMFVTNQGGFGRDLSDVFGYDYGTFYPYTSIAAIEDGSATNSPLYAAGLWIGGIVNGAPRVTLAEYTDEYVPGPMAAGTFQADAPEFKIYKLYDDSLAANPNADYLNWPVDQGAPVNADGTPRMRGKQMTWSVFNDANPAAHTNNGSSTLPLGVEVQQTVWAGEGGPTVGTTVYGPITVSQAGSSATEVNVDVVDGSALNGHDYEIRTGFSASLGRYFDVIDVTLGLTVLSGQPIPTPAQPPAIDGFAIRIVESAADFSSFELAALGASQFDPPRSAAVASRGFPTPGGVDAGDDLTPGSPRWAIHTADNGGSSGGGTRADYFSFLSRVTRDGSNFETIDMYDYEMRFTGDPANPGVGGSYAIEWFNDDNVFWVPFELWRTGIGTPNDPSDDVRLVPFVIDDGDDNVFGLESYGSSADASCEGDCEHSVSPDDDDPFTDWVYWNLPADQTPGETGYLANEAQMLAGTFDASLIWNEIMARTVLVNINAGKTPPYAAEQFSPEQGSIFRIVTAKGQPADTFSFTAHADVLSGGGTTVDELSIYTEYRIINKGANVIDSAYLGFWSDPDLGGAGDDLVGCDPEEDRWFCYNSTNNDQKYGSSPPALGFRLLLGPVVAEDGAVAFSDGQPRFDQRQLRLSSFEKYINGTDPEDAQSSYCAMQGLDPVNNCAPYTYGGAATTFWHSGDPVSGSGDLDQLPADRRMMAGVGPLTMLPGDSQSVLLKMAVGHGGDRLSSIALLRNILSYDPWSPLVAGTQPASDSISAFDTAVVIDFGDVPGYSIGLVDTAGLALNGDRSPDSITIMTGVSGFNGSVYRLWFSGVDLLDGAGPGDTLRYFISGLTTGGRNVYAVGSLHLQRAAMGDANGDGEANLTDVTLLVNHVFLNGPPPAYPYAADAYCDGAGRFTLTDITRLINYIFLNGPEPTVCDIWLP